MTFLQENEVFGALRVDEVFVFYDGPRLFTAKNAAEQVYLVNSLDSEDGIDSWIVSALSERRLTALRSGDLKLRDAFSLPEMGFVHFIASDLKGDLLEIRRLQPGELTEDDLPAKSISLAQFSAQKVEDSRTAVQLAKTLNANVVLFRLFPNREVSEVPAKVLGDVLGSVQSYLSNRIESMLAPVSEAVRQTAANMLNYPFRVNVAGTFPGSFGVELAVRGDAPEITSAIKMAVEDLGTASEVLTFKELMQDADNEQVNIMRRLLKELSDAGSDLSIEAASQQEPESIRVDVPLPRIRSAVETLKRPPIRGKETVTVTGNLTGLDLRTRRFVLESIRDEKTYKGSVPAGLFNSLNRAELPCPYRAVLEGSKRDDATGKEVITGWRMLSASKLS